jgi:hypothetical protein
MKIQSIEGLDKLKMTGMKSLSPKRPKLSISMSTCGHALGSDVVYHRLIKEKEKTGIKLSVSQVGCSGFCNLEPMVILRLPGQPALL